MFFEKENIHSMSGDGELMLTILASFAQEESRSVSENCKWRIRNKFKEGIPFSFSIIGYDLKNGQLEVIPHEADIVRMIFNDYLSGMGKNAIMKKLNEMGIKTKKGCQWDVTTVDRVLRNEKYAGDLLLQKFFSSNHIEKQKCENTGQLPRYHVKDSHEAIIDRDTFSLVQQKLEENTERFQPKREVYRTYPYTWKIVCEKCEKNYRRKINSAGTKYEKPVWICSTYNSLGKAACPSQQIPENIMDYYTKHIQSNPAWEFVDVYADEGISATSTKKREGFNRMIVDALGGKIHLIITKSVSRFARNTVDTLTTVRQLKEKGVDECTPRRIWRKYCRDSWLMRWTDRMIQPGI